jgi:hypothetical protein
MEFRLDVRRCCPRLIRQSVRGTINGLLLKAAGTGTEPALYTTNENLQIQAFAYHPLRGACYSLSSRILCVKSPGQPAVLAGTGVYGFGGDGGPATQALLTVPQGFSFDASGSLYFVDADARVRVVDTAGIIDTLFKGGSAPPVADPNHVAVDPSGNVYVSDSTSDVVWKIAPDGTASIVAGTGLRGVGGENMPAIDSPLFSPQGIAVDGLGNLYITELGAHRLRKVQTDGKIRTIAGNGTQGFAGDGGLGTNAMLDTPMDVAADASGTVYIADTYNNRVRRVTPDGIITTVAGNGPQTGFNSGVSLGDGRPATAAQMNNPGVVAIGPSGHVYVSDGYRVRRFLPGGNIETVAGNGTCRLAGDGGIASGNSVCFPGGLAAGASGVLYVSDPFNARVRQIDSAGVINTIAGNGVSGFSGDGGPAVDAQLNSPGDIAVDATGNVYVADLLNKRIRKISAGARCSVSLAAVSNSITAAATSGTVTVTPSTNCGYTAESTVEWVHLEGGTQSGAGGIVQYSVDANLGVAARSGSIRVATGGSVAAYYVYRAGASCHVSISPAVVNVSAVALDSSFQVSQTPAGCAASEASSDSSWLTLTGVLTPGASNVGYHLTNNPGASPRTATIGVGGRTLTVVQAGSPIVLLSPAPGSTLPGSRVTFSWTSSGADWFRYDLSTAPSAGDLASDSTPFSAVTISNIPRNGQTIYFRLWYQTLSTWQPVPIEGAFTAAGPVVYPKLGFYPIAPCRVADTRADQRSPGPFGPPFLSAYSPRDFNIPSSGCGVPGTASAYSLNVTALPSGSLDFLSIWPAGEPYPNVSTLNSVDGSVLANAAITSVSATGSVRLVSGRRTEVIIDMNGYFAPPTGSELAFYPITPCRVADTRTSQPKTGAFGPPSLKPYSARDFPIASSPCGVPPSAAAYALNITAIPQGPLDFLSWWPTGQPYPGVSTLNATSGAITANAAIVVAGANGAVRVVTGKPSDLIIDVNGYFARNDGTGLHFYPVTPCRVADTRSSQGKTGAFGPPALTGYARRDFPIAGVCDVPSSARAYSLNVTAIPRGPLDFLSVWPAGQPYPYVSTLNSPLGLTIANAAIVPAGTGGAISVVTGNPTELIIDVNGYFAPY